MKPPLFRTGALACLLCLTAPLIATSQISPGVPSADSTAHDDYEALQAAQQRRVELAGDVASGRTTPESALAQLRTITLPARLRGDPDTDFAHAAIDVGQRLNAVDKRTDAGRFFEEADESLSGVLERTADTEVAANVQLLSSRGFIRAQFLNKIPEAIADLDAAQKLAPDDPHLQDLRRQLLSDKAAWLESKPRG